MVALSSLEFLFTRVVGLVGTAIVVMHNSLDGIRSDQAGIFGWAWHFLHASGPILYGTGDVIDVAYPVLPWIGVMAAGYAFGPILLKEGRKRRAFLWKLGLGLTAAFVAVRATGLYGDPNPWTTQKNLLFTVFDFVDCEKYPPSLLFTLMTLGPAIASLSFLELWKGRIAAFFVVFGRVPLFFYVLHVFFIHGLAMLFWRLAGFDISFMTTNVGHSEWPADYGFSLPVVYVVWVFVISALYLPCRWFAELKRQSNRTWVSYL
jgi:uncharacterized membrane protein